MSAKITLGPSETFTESREGKTMRRYPVLADGTLIGTVAQHRAETVTAYSSRMYGYARTRTCWQWHSVDNAGDSEFTTRGAALDDLVEYATSTGLLTAAAEERYAEQSDIIAEGFTFELCEECGLDFEDHYIAPDALGNAHAYCYPTLESLCRIIVSNGRGSEEGAEAHEEIKRRIGNVGLDIAERRAAFRAHNRITGNGEVHGPTLVPAAPAQSEQWLYEGNHERLVKALVHDTPAYCHDCAAPTTWGPADCRYCQRYSRPCGRHDAHKAHA